MNITKHMLHCPICGIMYALVPPDGQNDRYRYKSFTFDEINRTDLRPVPCIVHEAELKHTEVMFYVFTRGGEYTGESFRVPLPTFDTLFLELEEELPLSKILDADTDSIPTLGIMLTRSGEMEKIVEASKDMIFVVMEEINKMVTRAPNIVKMTGKSQPYTKEQFAKYFPGKEPDANNIYVANSQDAYTMHMRLISDMGMI